MIGNAFLGALGGVTGMNAYSVVQQRARGQAQAKIAAQNAAHMRAAAQQSLNTSYAARQARAMRQGVFTEGLCMYGLRDAATRRVVSFARKFLNQRKKRAKITMQLYGKTVNPLKVPKYSQVCSFGG